MGVDKKLLERWLGDISVGVSSVILFGSLQEVSLPLFYLELVLTKYSRKFSAFVCRWIASMIPCGSELTQPGCSLRTFFILVCLFRGLLGRQLRRLPRRMFRCFKYLRILFCAFCLYATKKIVDNLSFSYPKHIFCFLLPIFRQTIKK